MKAHLKLLGVSISAQEFSSLVNMAMFIDAISSNAIKEFGMNAQDMKYMAHRILELSHSVDMQMDSPVLEEESSTEETAEDTSSEAPESYASSESSTS